MERIYDEVLLEKLTTKKLLIVKGPKYSSKASYLQSLIESFSTVQLFDFNDKKVRAKFESIEENELLQLLECPYILLKEAQSLSSIQRLVEMILFNNAFNCTVVITSSYDPLLMEELVEALKVEDAIVEIYPPLFQEIAKEVGLVNLDQSLHHRLIYGNFPSVLTAEDPKEELNVIMENTIFTRLNPSERMNKKEKLIKVLQFISFHLGENLSYNEIGFYAGLDNETVERYIDLLVKSYVLIKLPSYYTGKRYELKKAHTFYFFDNGIRNAIIQNFNPIDLRIDIAALWKNWLIAERMKWNHFLGREIQYYCWKTNTNQHVDLIEIVDRKMTAYQTLWDKRKKAKFPKSFEMHYTESLRHTINKSTYWAFLSKKQ